MIKGCVDYIHGHATFVHIPLDSRVCDIKMFRTIVSFSEKCLSPDVDCVKLPHPRKTVRWIFNHVGMGKCSGVLLLFEELA